MDDAKQTVPCPECGFEVGYLFSEDGVDYHICRTHGYVVVLTDGRVMLAAPSDHEWMAERLRRVH